MEYVLESERYSIGLAPARGGRVEWLRLRHQGAEYDIFRPRPEEQPEQGSIPFYGNFAMLPFCNRLMPMEMQTSDGPVPVTMNWPSESCAIHGLGCGTAWSVQDSSSSSFCEYTCRVEAADSIFLGTGLQQVTVCDGGGLVHRVGFRNEGFDWILAGVGFHPWFYLPEPGARLEFCAKGRFATDTAQFPQEFQELDNPDVLLDSEAHDGLDQCFAGWSGRAILHLPHLPVPVMLNSDAPTVHVYLNTGLQAMCVEPQTHVANATHDSRWNDLAGMTKLSRGETMWLQYRIGLASLD